MDANLGETSQKNKKKAILVNKNSPGKKKKLLGQKDSEYVGLEVRSEKVITTSCSENPTQQIQLIDQNVEIKHPLIVLFPGLAKDKTADNILSGELEPEEVTKKLVGKKPDFSLLKKGKRTLLLDDESGATLLNIQEENQLSSKIILSEPSEDSVP